MLEENFLNFTIILNGYVIFLVAMSSDIIADFYFRNRHPEVRTNFAPVAKRTQLIYLAFVRKQT